MQYANPFLGNGSSSPLSLSGSWPRCVTLRLRYTGAPERSFASTMPSIAEMRAMTMRLMSSSGSMLNVATSVHVEVVPTNMAISACSCASRLSSISCSDFPSGGVCSACPVIRSLRVWRIANSAEAASSARLAVDWLCIISSLTTWRAAAVSSGVGAAWRGSGRDTPAAFIVFSVLTASGTLLAERIMNGAEPLLNCTA